MAIPVRKRRSRWQIDGHRHVTYDLHLVAYLFVNIYSFSLGSSLEKRTNRQLISVRKYFLNTPFFSTFAYLNTCAFCLQVWGCWCIFAAKIMYFLSYQMCGKILCYVLFSGHFKLKFIIIGRHLNSIKRDWRPCCSLQHKCIAFHPEYFVCIIYTFSH